MNNPFQNSVDKTISWRAQLINWLGRIMRTFVCYAHLPYRTFKRHLKRGVDKGFKRLIQIIQITSRGRNHMLWFKRWILKLSFFPLFYSIQIPTWRPLTNWVRVKSLFLIDEDNQVKGKLFSIINRIRITVVHAL